jgi:hypothetical protein
MLFINAEQQNYIIILSALLQIFFNEPSAASSGMPVQNTEFSSQLHSRAI